ncbi:MAG: hypothetical protein U0807_16195 [Candidatus Binatia bacterium]
MTDPEKLRVVVPAAGGAPAPDPFAVVPEIKLAMAEGDHERVRVLRAQMVKQFCASGVRHDPRGTPDVPVEYVAVAANKLSPAGRELLAAVNSQLAFYNRDPADIGERARLTDALASALRLNVDTVERQQIAHGVWA